MGGDGGLMRRHAMVFQMADDYGVFALGGPTERATWCVFGEWHSGTCVRTECQDYSV